MATDSKRPSDGPEHYEDEDVEINVPDEVCQYLQYFYRMLEDENVDEILGLYEQGFPEITERFFNEKIWPDSNVVERIIRPATVNQVTPEGTPSTSHLFIILYRELYFRDVYTRSQRGPSLQYRWGSYMNYQELFAEILYNSETPIRIQLPNLWLWDIVDEFVYQFQAFCLYKTNPGKRSNEESEDLLDMEESSNVWNIYPFLNILYSLVAKSQINEQLKAIREGIDPDTVADEFGRSILYFKLGYFSLIGLLRTHVLLGDYHQALQTVENLEFDPKGLYNSVPACLVTLHYFVGFSHMMMRNYGEATKIFVNCLLYIQRTQNLTHNAQPISQQKKGAMAKYDVIGKTNEQLFPLLAICLTLQPQRIDESVQSQLYERAGDRMQRMANGDMEEFRNSFLQGSPKFLSPTTIVLQGANISKEPQLRQCSVFLEGIESQLCLPILRGYLKLYTSLPCKKLAAFMDVKNEDFETFIGKLLTFKMIVNELGKETADRSDGDDTADLDFYVDKDMIIVADTKVARRIAEYFVKHIQKLQHVYQTLQAVGSTQ